jgi:hypothetical protein
MHSGKITPIFVIKLLDGETADTPYSLWGGDHEKKMRESNLQEVWLF